MHKKSQAQIFVYAFALVVAGLVLLFGYKAIFAVGKQAENSRFAEFKAELESDLTTIAFQFGTVKRVSYDVPGFISTICFYSQSSSSSNVDQSCQSFSQQPLVKDAINDNFGKNVFLLGELPQALHIDYVDTGKECALRCFDTERGKVSMLLEGRGNNTLISS